MRKLLSLTLSLATLGFVASSAEAKATETSRSVATTVSTSAVAPQIRIQLGGRERRGRWRRNDHRFRTITQTRIVRYGWQTFRETYETTYFPNGRVQTRLISRVRVR